MNQRASSSPEHRAEKVKELFSLIAHRYDLINDLQSLGLHRFWKWRTLQLAQVRAGERALDVCCGTGDLAIGLARRGAQTIGLDFNEQMLRLAQDRVQRMRQKHSLNLSFVQGDAQQIPFTDESFDIVTTAYGLRNLESWEQGIGEMLRVAKPNGRLLVLEFGKPDNALWRSIYFRYLRLFVPLLGRIFCANAGAYAYILDSLQRYPGQQAVLARMQQLGLTQLRIVQVLGGAMSIHYGKKV